MKKFLASLILFSLWIPSAFAVISVQPFEDLPVGHADYDNVMFLYNEGIVGGYPDGTFHPEREINRAEFLKMLVEGTGSEPTVEYYHDCFTDVTTEWFAPYVCKAKGILWVDGYPDGSFKPAQTINKVEAIKMVLNSQMIGPAPANIFEKPFEDVPVDAWYTGYVNQAKQTGILEETGSQLNPGDNMTRGEVAALLANAIRYVETVLFDGPDYYDPLYNGDDIYYEEAFMERVIDGDTIEVNIDGTLEKVRLLGIDTPELSGDECYATEAKDYLESLLMGDADMEVTLFSDSLNDNRDKYDRLLRYVAGDYGDSGLVMLQMGYARYYDTYEIKLADGYAAAEQEARDKQYGIWRDCDGVDDADEKGGDTGGVVSGDSTVTIVDVFYDGDVPLVESDEYVEVKNNGAAAVNLKGYRIKGSKGDESYVFPSLELAPGESVKVYTNQGEYSFENDAAIWNNSGEICYLYDAEGTLVSEWGW